MNDTSTSNAVLCAGRLYCDLVFTGAASFPKMGTETFSKDLTLHAGGGAFITAAAFSALGWKASVLATFPAPPFDTIARDDFEKFNVDASLCAEAARNSAPQITVAIAGEEDRAFLSHKAGSALPDIEVPGASYRHLHIGELRSLIEHPNLIPMARNSGMTISVDCGWDSELLGQGQKMTELLSKTDIFLPNKTEFDHLIASGLPKNTAPLTVVKCGADGSQSLENGEWIIEPTKRAIVVDATGAGDAFNGGFLSSWLKGKSLRTCLADGNQCGRLSVLQAGGTGGLLTLQHDIKVSRVSAAR
jgi:sugar/nucleoside kinase (ribokinase family)